MKKLILIALLSLTSTIALATSLHPDTFKPSYDTFKSVAPETVVVSPLCPDHVTCITDGTIVDLEYMIPCSANIISFTYEAQEIGEELHLFVSAIVGTKQTNPPVCQAFSHITQNIQLINMFGDVIVHNLGLKTITVPEGK